MAEIENFTLLLFLLFFYNRTNCNSEIPWPVFIPFQRFSELNSWIDVAATSGCQIIRRSFFQCGQGFFLVFYGDAFVVVTFDYVILFGQVCDCSCLSVIGLYQIRIRSVQFHLNGRVLQFRKFRGQELFLFTEEEKIVKLLSDFPNCMKSMQTHPIWIKSGSFVLLRSKREGKGEKLI